MTGDATGTNQAIEAGEKTLADVYECLDAHKSFLVEAGAGAGKTYTLIKALQYLIEKGLHILPRSHQRIACITFTNVAKDQIDREIDRDPLIFCDTIHAFCWSLISVFQKQLRARVVDMNYLSDRIEEAGGILQRKVEYTLGYRGVSDTAVSIHHDDVLLLTIALMENKKFRRILKQRYPVILIDEYQDTNAGWVEAIKTHLLGQEESPLLGFFGDHWQKIYGDGCGNIEHEGLKRIGKQANFRSVPKIVECLNRMRPELTQFPSDASAEGSVRVFHTNTWAGNRKPGGRGGHWEGDLPDEESDAAFARVQQILLEDGWDMSAAKTKILMLTHRVLAAKQGYQSIPGVFRFNESFTRKESTHIAFFSDVLEPAYEAYCAKKYGEMFRIIGSRAPLISNPQDKAQWTASMDAVGELRNTGTVGQMIDHLRQSQRPRLTDAVERRERRLEQHDPEGEEPLSRSLSELAKLRDVPYPEIVALSRYLSGHSPFETKHGVKGAEFDNVLIIAGRGWNQYNFNKMLELAGIAADVPAGDQAFFESNRNLFYVACSRPKKRLAILFTQELSGAALATLSSWFGEAAVEAMTFT
jgi:DNA helicase-2/ATP-dependent DNA helicase PcrA